MKIKTRLFWFLVVGAIAALTHLITVYLAVRFINLSPLISNIFAFMIAFQVSYSGHKKLTFAKLEENKQLKLIPFLGVALTSFSLNEGLYYLFLRFTSFNYLFALVLVLILSALFTFIASRFWACR